MRISGHQILTQTQLDTGDLTRLRVLDCLRANGSMARKEIATAINASPATVTAITAKLLQAGLIQEHQTDATGHSPTRGRPRVMLRLNAKALVVAGIKVARKSVSVVLCDFVGNEFGALTVDLPKSRQSASDLAQIVGDAIDKACLVANIDVLKLAGVSIGLAGQVDAARNHVHWSSSLQTGGTAFADELSARLPCPVYVENDANLVAKAEQLFGIGKAYRNFLVLTVEHGVGLGIVIGGALYRGERGCGAEFGHTKVHLDGALCQCGQRGCLEAYVGEYALIREMSQGEEASALRTATDIARLAGQGHPRAQAVLERAGQMFAIGVANLINIFDPECLILSGAQAGLGFLDSADVTNRIRQSTTAADGTLPPMFVGDLGDNMWAKGAAALAIENVSLLKMHTRPQAVEAV